MTSLIALFIFCLAFAPLTVAIYGDLRGIFFAPALSACVATVGGMAHVMWNTSVWAVWLAFVSISQIVAWSVPAIRRQVINALRRQLRLTEKIESAIGLIAVVLVAAAQPPPIEWDARSIWFFHASWLLEPSEFYTRAANAHLLDFSHPNYPLAVPGSGAVTMQLAGGVENLHLVQATTTIIGMSLAVCAGLLVTRAMGSATSPVIRIPGFALFITAPLALAERKLDKGYADMILALSIAGIVAVILATLNKRIDSKTGIILIIFSSLAAASKQEGLWFVIAVLSIAIAVRGRKFSPWPIYSGLSSIFIALSWKVVLTIRGIPDISDASGMLDRVRELFVPESRAWQIVAKVVTFNAGLEVWLSLLALLLACCGWITTRRDGYSVRGSLLMVLSWLCIMGIVLITYALGNTRDHIDFWLVTSLTRVTASATVLAYVAFLVLALQASPWRKTSQMVTHRRSEDSRRSHENVGDS